MENLQTFLDQMEIEMTNQTRDIISQIDEKLAPLKREIVSTGNVEVKDINRLRSDAILESSNGVGELISRGLDDPAVLHNGHFQALRLSPSF
ncbi:unnamed protein product, partial [Leptidea sinapis]